jgi:hypothetical protein
LSTASGLVFHLGATGYYAFVLSSGGPQKGTREVAFKLIKWTYSSGRETVLVKWTKVVPPATLDGVVETQRKLSVRYSGGQIDVFVDDQPVATVQDTTFPHGLIGIALFGHGRAVFNDLLVEGPP